MRAAKAFAEKYSPGGNLPTRTEVQAQQRQVIEGVLQQVALENKGAEDEPITLLPLSAFQASIQEADWEQTKPVVVVPLREGERFVVHLEESALLRSYGPWRNDELAEQGVSCCEQDAQSLAKGLLAAIQDRLSIYQLEHVVAVFSAELARLENERREHERPRPTSA